MLLILHIIFSKPQAIAWNIKGTTQKTILKDEKWQIVKNGRTRRKNNSQCSLVEEETKNDKIYINSYNNNLTGGSMLAPRSAMDLPQTKVKILILYVILSLLWLKWHIQDFFCGNSAKNN